MFRRTPVAQPEGQSQQVKANEADKVSGEKRMDNRQDITNEAKKADDTSSFAQARKPLEIPQTARRPQMPQNTIPGAPVSQGSMPQNSIPQQSQVLPQGLQMSQSNLSTSMGNFGFSSSANIGHNSQNSAPADTKRLVIGEGISISGDINSCEYLIVEGSVKSDFKGSDRLDISKTGEFKGSAETKEADVAGTFEGTLIVNGRLTVRSSGKIRGNVYYKELAVEAGAVIDGKINAIDENTVKTLSKVSSSSTTQPSKKKPASSKKTAVKNDAASQQSLLATG